MRLKFNGVKYKYKPKYIRREDDLNIEYPTYSSYCSGLVYYNEEWRKCNFWIFKEKGKMTIDVSPVGIVQDKMSSIGPTNDQGNVARLQANSLQRFLINTYDKVSLLRSGF